MELPLVCKGLFNVGIVSTHICLHWKSERYKANFSAYVSKQQWHIQENSIFTWTEDTCVKIETRSCALLLEHHCLLGMLPRWCQLKMSSETLYHVAQTDRWPQLHYCGYAVTVPLHTGIRLILEEHCLLGCFHSGVKDVFWDFVPCSTTWYKVPEDIFNVAV
jgi:hypothetical protein